MAISEYVANLRKHVGKDLLMLPSACAVVVDDSGRILPGRRADTGKWSLPAGAIDSGEQPADAAVREVHEETGVHVAVERLAGVALREVTPSSMMRNSQVLGGTALKICRTSAR